MTTAERNAFRTTTVWKSFRNHIQELFKNKDPITGKKLNKGFNLHHLDCNKDNYAILDDNKFIPLNSNTHKVWHIIYQWFIDDPSIIDRLLESVKKSAELNGNKKF